LQCWQELQAGASGLVHGLQDSDSPHRRLIGGLVDSVRDMGIVPRVVA
jgi:hypothetical protein